MRSRTLNQSSLKCSLPLNIRCSKRWANPVFPGRSFFDPTWYQTFTATMGALGSSCTMRTRPLGSTKRWKGIFGVSMLGAESGVVLGGGDFAAGVLAGAAGGAASTRAAARVTRVMELPGAWGNVMRNDRLYPIRGSLA